MKKTKELYSAGKITIVSLLIVIFFTSFVIVNAGERGVLMKFGQVQERVLGEGIHLIVPIANTVKKLSVRLQNQQISAKAASKDLQIVFTNVAFNWHIIPEEVNTIFQQIGDKDEVIKRIISPAVEEVLKAVVADYTAEEIISKRGEIKVGVYDSLTKRLARYHIGVDDVSLVDAHFSKDFEEAVEAKKIAEQEVKRAEFLALKASKEADAKVNLAKGEAEAHKLLRENLTTEILQKQAIEKWNGKLPLIVDESGSNLLDLSELVKAEEN